MNISKLLSDYDQIISKEYGKWCQKKTITTNYEMLAFSSASRRIISCLVNEELVISTLLKIWIKHQAKDLFWIVLHSKCGSEFSIWIPLTLNVTGRNINYDIVSGTVRFIDPSDLGHIIVSSYICDQVTQCKLVTEICQIFRLIVDAGNECVISKIMREITDSIQHQVLAYKAGASFTPLWRPHIQYEQEITVGHATHPMNKSRLPVHGIPKTSMAIYGDYERIIRVVAKKLNICYNPETEIIVPVHELQQDVIYRLFDVLPLQKTASVNAQSECSLRTVNIADIHDYTFKLPLALTISSAMRTITHWSVYSGPPLGAVIQKIVETNKYLTFLNECGSIIGKDDDFSKSKHFACIIRENVSVKLSDPLETAIVCAYLTEIVNGEHNITKLFDLKTQLDKEEFSDLYARLLIDSFFDCVHQFGFSFEAHQQNVLLKVRKNSPYGFELVGFIVRDYGGIKVHQETLYSKIGRTVSVLDRNASILADTLDDVYTLCYHTLFHCHLQQIFRALGTHHNGRGWKFVREHLNTKKEFLAIETCVNFFFAELVPYKCFMKMKLNHFERTYEYTSVPNIIHFDGI